MAWIAYTVGVGAIGAALLLGRGLREAHSYTVRRVKLPAAVTRLPPLKLLHITDTHFNGHDDRLLRFLEGLTEEEFDLVAYTGDIIHHKGGLASLRRMVGMFRPRLGSFAVLAGHDYVHVGTVESYLKLLLPRRPNGRRPTNPVGEIKDALRDADVHLLQDTHHVLETGKGRPLAIVGLKDAYLYRPSVRHALEKLPRDTPVLALAHSPDVLPALAQRGADVALFGHTHGGQIRLPFLGALVTRTDLPRRAARGVFRLGRTIASVSAGLGTAPAYPVRLLCPPEAVIVEIACPPENTTSIRELDLG